MGLILGTGTNAAYVEKLDAMPKCLAEEEANTVKRRLRDEGAEAQMVVNTEWGAFGGNNPVCWNLPFFISIVVLKGFRGECVEHC